MPVKSFQGEEPKQKSYTKQINCLRYNDKKIDFI